MTERTATLIGATGLIGGELLKLLLDDDYYSTVKILIRRPVDWSHPKLKKELIDFNDNDSFLMAIDNSDAVFCTVGTTQKKVKGDKLAYRKVDYDIPVKSARFCKMTGCKTFVLVSSIGDNSKSGNFYIKLKGEVEDEIKALEIDRVHIMRPSMLLGERNESRPMEKVGQVMMKAFSFLIPAKFKAVEATKVAKAMLAASKQTGHGVFVYDYIQIKKLAG
jgi:uncharacterized protein YbjT (DUF2867 family)